MIDWFKGRLAGFMQWHVVAPLARLQRESVYQALVQRDLARRGIPDDFYPVGAAASYGLLYLLVRIMSENTVESIAELGSGESTRLLNALKRPGTYHVAHEEYRRWHEVLRSRVGTCDYRHRELEKTTVLGVECSWYRDVEPVDFDLLLVDGPVGVDRFSRIGCWKLIEANRKRDFVIVMDDCFRPGERETLDRIEASLRAKGLEVFSHRLESGASPAVLCCGRFAHVRFYF
jgi:hypothetical protein